MEQLICMDIKPACGGNNTSGRVRGLPGQGTAKLPEFGALAAPIRQNAGHFGPEAR